MAFADHAVGGVSSLIVDGGVVGQQQTRRARAAPKVQAFTEAEALAALPQWDPNVEARKVLE